MPAGGCDNDFTPDVEEGDEINLIERGGYYGHTNINPGRKDPQVSSNREKVIAKHRYCVFRHQWKASFMYLIE